MSTAELSLQSGLWLMLFVKERESGWPVGELTATLRALLDDEQLAPYLAPGAEKKFCRFVLARPAYFSYDAEGDTVALVKGSPITAVDQWLVRYLAQWIQGSRGTLEIGSEASAMFQCAVPRCVAEHLRVVYEGSLELFFKTHPKDFAIDESGTSVRLTPAFLEKSIAAFAEEESLVLFFIDLLHKVGATEDKPCNVHTLANYLPLMRGAERSLLQERYRENLNVFFGLNPANFATTKVKSGSVYLKNPDPEYGAALFLKQQVQIASACTSAHAPKVRLAELASIAKYSSSPVARPFSGIKSVGKKVRDIARLHPIVFHVDDLGDNVWLREECRPPWPGGQWGGDAELLSVAYFIDVLRHIDATSPSRAICFNYIVRAASSAPPNCKGYLESVYPALEVISLFHLHPDIFDLSSVNRVCLKTTEEAPETREAPGDAGTESSPDSAEKQAALYASKLLKYVRDLSPDLLAICMESASPGARTYYMATLKGRQRSVVESGRAALLLAERPELANPDQGGVSARTTSEASTQTAAEQTPPPVSCQSGREIRASKNKWRPPCKKANAPKVSSAKKKKVKKAPKTSLENQTGGHKVSVASASPASSNPTAASRTDELGKAGQQAGLPQQAQPVGGGSVGGELFEVLERLAKLPPDGPDAGSSAKKLPLALKTSKTVNASKAAIKVTVEVSKATVCKAEGS